MGIKNEEMDLRVPHEIVGDSAEVKLPKKKSAKDLELERLDKQIALVERKLAEVKEQEKKSDGKYAMEMHEFKLRETRRSDYFVEMARTTIANTRKNLQKTALGSLLDKCSFQLLGKSSAGEGYAMFEDKPEEIADIRNGANVRTLQGLVNTLGEEAVYNGAKNTKDPHVREILQKMRTQSLMYNYYSHNYKDQAQTNLVFGALLLPLGYHWSGPLGALGTTLVGKGVLNKSQASQASYYQIQGMARKMDAEKLGLMIDSNAYSMNKNQTWLTYENFRAAAAKDEYIPRSRGEFANISNPIHEQLGRMGNIPHDYAAQFEFERTRANAEQSKLLLDIFTSIGTAITGGD
jgi:hypothetical protein